MQCVDLRSYTLIFAYVVDADVAGRAFYRDVRLVPLIVTWLTVNSTSELIPARPFIPLEA